MTFKIVVIDDEDIGELIRNINLDELSYDHVKPCSFKNDIESISDTYDLILMDQKLAGNIGKIPYMGTTLIQELRTRMAEGHLRSKPVILWSIAGNINSYQNEKSSHNLVDAVWNKEWLHHGNVEKRNECARIIRALINGYSNIRAIIEDFKFNSPNEPSKLASKAFDVDLDLVSEYIPEAVLGHLLNKNHHITHSLSNFFINSILRFNGFLIDEKTLAARLGVDIQCSDWETLRDKLPLSCKFSGIYSDLYERWWATEFESWWLEFVYEEHAANLTAAERVDILNSTFNLSLKSAKPATKHTESRFWHCCIIDGVPIDEIDSYKVTSSERREWQDHFYASFEAINLKRHKQLGYELTLRDKERFLKLRKEKKAYE